MNAARRYRIRASYPKSMLDECRRDAKGKDIVAAVGADVVARIDGEVSVGLVDSGDYDVLMRAIVAVGGEELLTEISRRHMVRFRDSPIVRPLIDAVVRLTGLTPHTIFRIAPRARANVVADGGTLETFREGDKQARLALRGFPGHQLPLTVVHLRGGWLGILDVCKVDGACDVVVTDHDAADADFVIRWS